MNATTRLVCALLVTLAVAASRLHARGGGGCLEQGTLIATPHGAVPIEQLRVGDAVWGNRDGRPVAATVQALTRVEPERYLELTVDGRSVRVTPEHPVEVSRGVFVRADHLQPGQSVVVSGEPNAAPAPYPLASLVTRSAAAPAYNLLVSPGGVFTANGIAVHNKGCFLPDTPITMADGTRRPISQVQAGDEVLAFEADGALVHARVHGVLTHLVDSYLILRTEHVEVRVTEEHPFYVGHGTFKTAEALQLGEPVMVCSENALIAQTVLAIERVSAPATVYNLQTDSPHTFLANGVAVHNKGGGCFVPGTRIATPDGNRPIESLRLGDTVYGVEPGGRLVATAVAGVYLNHAVERWLRTDRGVLRTTDEHPLLTADGFVEAGDLGAGDRLATARGLLAVREVGRGAAEVPVYTLKVGGPHTFVADGAIVHNKGGGFHGGGYHSGGSRGGSSDSSDLGEAIFTGVGLFVFLIVMAAKFSSGNQDEELDYCYSRGQIDAKAAKTMKLLQFIARTDAKWEPEKLRTAAHDTFQLLQRCWRARDYGPMKTKMMAELYEDHCRQIEAMRQNHEINMLDSLRIEAVDLVHVEYAAIPNARWFTALFTASARDYYVDDRSGSKIRGDDGAARFQEFWSFQFQDGAWLLREIEQTKESSLLTRENFFEPFTDAGRDQVYGEHAGEAGPAGPALPADVSAKADKIDRLLNFLVQTDKIWNRDLMLGAARRAFTQIQLAWQDGRPEALTGSDIDPTLADDLRRALVENQRQKLKVELRNFCVRKIELILVDNRDDRTQDQFTARISAHAQMVITRSGTEVRRDPWVRAWTDYWTFGRNANGTGWTVRAIHPPAEGSGLVARENTDEGSSVDMLQWYYSKTRAT